MSSDGELEPEVDLDRVISEEDKAKAVDMKTKANKAFAGEFCPFYDCPSFITARWTQADPIAKDFNASIDLYTEAISLDPHDPTFWNNRAMAKAKMEEHGAAIADASESSESLALLPFCPPAVLSSSFSHSLYFLLPLFCHLLFFPFSVIHSSPSNTSFTLNRLSHATSSFVTFHA